MNNSQRLHFVGIGGYGMSAIAKVMLDWGFEVSGSDVVEKAITEKLRSLGAQVYLGHDRRHIAKADLVIYSSDIPKNNVELVAALENKIPLIHRSEMLAKILNQRDGIAVAGAHGKTTTSSMIAYIMEQGGQDPTYVIGGEVMGLNSNAKAGKSNYVIAEADESDGSFLNYFPKIAVITNIEPDHLENYDGKFENLKAAYKKYLHQVRKDGCVIINYEDLYRKEMIDDLECDVITFGTSDQADYYVRDIQQSGNRVSFDLFCGQKLLGTIQLQIPGKHNVLNATSAVIACMRTGMQFDEIKEQLEGFRGAKRRFTVMGERHGITVVDDYAHHPTEIKATLAAAKASGKHVIAIFQPQRYTRTYFLFEEFSRAFSDADELYVLDIFSPAGEQRINGVSAQKLVDSIRKHSHAQAKFVEDRRQLMEQLKDQMKPGDLVLTMGAGDIWKMAEELAKYIMQENF